MNIDTTLVFSPHCFEVILLEAKKQRLRYFYESFFIDENLLGSESLMTDSRTIHSLQGSTATVENTPKLTLLKRQVLVDLCSLSNFLLCILEGIFEDEEHAKLNGAYIIQLFLFDLYEP